MVSRFRLLTLIVFFVVWGSCSVFAQPGISEMNQAAGQIRGYYFSLKDFCMVLASLFALLAGYRVYHNWQLNRHHFDAQLIAWLLSMIFCLIFRAYLEGLFGF